MDKLKRVIGSYEGTQRGPLFISIGGIHGNEPSGIYAIQEVLRMLEVEPFTNASFVFSGKFVGLVGNLAAIRTKRRFINKDLNRQLTPDHVHELRMNHNHHLDVEDRELLLLLDEIDRQIKQYKPDKVVILDLHTTSVTGGIFAIVTEDPESIRIGQSLHAPVVKGMLDGIHGTTMHYFNRKNYGVNITTLTFEAGQHDDPLSINRAISGIVATMRAIGCVKSKDVETFHDDLLRHYSQNLPKVTRLAYVHRIKPEDHFTMYPNYRNFQWIKKGEIVARDTHGPVIAPVEGYMLMPLYQSQGDDGFFILQKDEQFSSTTINPVNHEHLSSIVGISH